MKRLKWNKKIETGVQGAFAFLGTYGLCYLGSLMGITYAAFSITSVLLMVGVYWLLVRTKEDLSLIADRKQLWRRCRYAGMVSLVFSLSMIMGYQLQVHGLTECGVKGKGLILLHAVCVSIAIFPFANRLFGRLEKIRSSCPTPQNAGKEWKSWAVFGVSAAILFMCLVPVWLAYYPIIMSYDFHRQVNEAFKGFAWFWPYQPIVHTWVIWVFLHLGIALDNLEAGMAAMALSQMLLYSLVTAYACTFLYRILRKKWIIPAAILFFGVFPFCSVMVICTTKDVLFSILFLLFVLLMAERAFFRRAKSVLVLDCLLLLEGCIMVQFRNNALYAVAAFGILWVIFAAKKEKLRVLLLCVLLVAGGKGTAVVIKAALGTQLSPAKVEMYSVPIQQFARIGFYHAHELDEDTRNMLESYVWEEDWVGYNPPLADTVKSGVAVTTFSDTWEGHMGQLFTDWLHLGLRYPNEYLDAFLELTRGYWFWDDRSYAECLGYGTDGRMGVIYTYNSSEIENLRSIEHKSKFPWLEGLLEKVVSANEFYRWPVVSVLFKSAFYFWVLCLVFVAFLFLRQKKQAVFCLFPLTYMGTMLLGPVVQLRYIFPIMIVLPVLMALLFLPAGSGD